MTDFYPGSKVVKFLARGTIISSEFNNDLRIGNISGYGDPVGDGYYLLPNKWFLNLNGDGAVAQSSSENPNIISLNGFSNIILMMMYLKLKLTFQIGV